MTIPSEFMLFGLVIFVWAINISLFFEMGFKIIRKYQKNKQEVIKNDKPKVLNTIYTILIYMGVNNGKNKM